MADSADIAVQSSNYTGNAALGGAGGGAFKFDTRPLDNLTAYTNLYNKAQYDQKQKNADAAVKQLADLASINANLLWDKDKNYLVGELSDAIKQSNDLLGDVPTDPEDLMKWQMKFQGIVKKVNDDYDTGKLRSVARQSRIADIRTKYPNDPKTQDLQIAALDKKMNETDITTPLSAMADFVPTTFDVPNGAQVPFSQIATNGEDSVTTTGKIFDSQKSTQILGQELYQLNQKKVDVNSLEYKKMGETERNAIDVQNAKNTESPLSLLDQNAKNFNDVLLAKNPDGTQKYFSDGTFLKDKFESENSSISAIMPTYNKLKGLDEYNRNKTTELSTGAFTDKGFKFNLPTTVTKETFAPGIIDWKNGVTPTQLGLASMFANAPSDVVSKDLKHPGELSQNKRTFASLQNAKDINANTQANENYRKGLDMIMAGWKKDNKGLWVFGGGDGSNKAPASINNPASLFTTFTTGILNSMNSRNKNSLSVDVNALDPIAFKALGAVGQYDKSGNPNPDPTVNVTFKRDGTYYLTSKNGVNQQGTMGTLAQKYIEVTPATQGIQKEGETGFQGLTGDQIWHGLESGDAANKSGGGSSSDPTAGMTPSQKLDYYMKGGK